MLTKNTDLFRKVTAEHIAADAVIQDVYWDREKGRGCFIGCHVHSNDARQLAIRYGIPEMVVRIAEEIFESLPADEARSFFADLPDAIGHDGKDLTRVGWQFLASELRSLPPQSEDIQNIINPVILGLDMLATGQDWPRLAERSSSLQLLKTVRDKPYYHTSAYWAMRAVLAAAYAAESFSISNVGESAREVCDYASRSAAILAEKEFPGTTNDVFVSVRRQRDLLLTLLAAA